MAQSISQNYQHLIFGIKRGYPIIRDKYRDGLHAYIAGTLKNLDSPCVEINSVKDHIHILFRQSKMKDVAEIAGKVKNSSSKWMKTQGELKFKWQNGYGCFSVSSKNLDYVIAYIQNQEEHHKKITFKEEVEIFMKENHVDIYNEMYFWD